MTKSQGKIIVLGITGGIAAYKAAELTRLLRKQGHTIHVVMTKSAQEFITPLTLQTLSGNPVHTDLFDLTQESHIGHISLADRADLILVAPASTNTLAKVSHGFCDNLLTTIICATKAPVVFAPAMNVHMWENPITQENIKRLKKFGYQIIPPNSGSLACGYEGQGRLPEPQEILDCLKKILRPSR